MTESCEKRLGGTLKFDPVSEKYIVDKIDELSKSNSLSTFLINLIRIAFDNPDKLKREKDLKTLMDFMEKGGMTPLAEAHYNESKRQTLEMKHKIDEIYDMCLKMYTLSQFGKIVGLEDKTKNTARAEFVLERHLNQLRDILGVRSYSLFESAKTLSIEAKSTEILDYIITHYENIIDEIKADVSITVPVGVSGVVQQVAYTSPEPNNEKSKAEETDTKKIKVEDLDTGAPIDVGDGPISVEDDLSDLERFFGT